MSHQSLELCVLETAAGEFKAKGVFNDYREGSKPLKREEEEKGD